MKKSFMTRVLAVSLSAAMAFSMSSASNLMTASAASTVNLKTTFKTLKVNQTYKMTLKKNTLNWKITKVTTTNKKICTVYGKTASSVMLKGKGVGRAKITVKVKTTKRKYPKNIKNMKCTVNVKAAGPSIEDVAFSATAAANSNTEVRVNFTKAVDAAAVENFKIAEENVSVSKAELSEDKKSVLLTIAGAEYSKNYNLTVTGIKVGGTVQADQKLTFTTPSPEVLNPTTLTAERAILKSDGQDATTITFKITDKDGKPLTDKGMEVRFTTNLGKFATDRVSIQNGEAKVMYTSEALSENHTAVITATIIEAPADTKLIGTTATTSVTLMPNPDQIDDTSIGATLTSITAPTADRIYAYFNKEVRAEDFKIKDQPNTKKFAADIKSGLDNGYGESASVQSHNIVGILPVENDNTALQLLVDKPMVDNSIIKVEFENKTQTNGIYIPKNTAYCKLTDARQPAVVSVNTPDQRTIEIEFSEAVLPDELCGWGDEKYDKVAQAIFAANNLDNYQIDGIQLSNEKYWGKIVPGRDSEGSTSGTDAGSSLKLLSEKILDEDNSKDGSIKVGAYGKRNVVTIKLSRERYLAPGSHRISVANVGDWAAKTDKERNIVSTEGFDFEVSADTSAPTFTATAMSPEQYLLEFSSDIVSTDGNNILTTDSEQFESVIKLEAKSSNGTWSEISNGSGKGSGKNAIQVSQVKEGDTLTNKYLVEVKADWTDVYNTSSTRDNYYRHAYRLTIAADKIQNAVNGIKNSALSVELTDDIMKTSDAKSPEIEKIEDAEGNIGSYNVYMTEPVKLSASANKEGLTPNQTQQSGSSTNMGVPAPEAQFVHVGDGRTVEGIIEDNVFVDAYDQIINVVPESELGNGEWDLIVRSISDDIGNTAPTLTKRISIDNPVTETNFRVVWAAVGYNPGAYYKYDDERNVDYGRAIKDAANSGKGNCIYVKFNKPVTLFGTSTNAQSISNYTLNGSPLPTGTEIRAHIKGYDEEVGMDTVVTDSVTIVLPQDRFSFNGLYLVSSLNTMLNISKTVTCSTTNELLDNGGMVRIPFQIGSGNSNDKYTTTGNTDLVPFISSLDAKTDAVWGNAASEQFGTGTDNIKNIQEYYEKFKAALEDEKYRKVVLNTSLNLTNTEDKDMVNVFGRSGTLTIKRAVDLDLNGNDIIGNVVVTTDNVADDMYIYSSGKQSTITGKNEKDSALTVNAGKIKEFWLQNVEVARPNINNGSEWTAVSLNDVWVNSFVLYGDTVINGNINVTDANGFGLKNESAKGAKAITGNINIQGTGKANLSGDFTSQIINVNQGAEVYLAGSKLGKDSKIVVNSSAAKLFLDTLDLTAGNTAGKPTILAAAKDVQIYVSNNVSVKDISFEKNSGCGIVEIDDKGKKKDTNVFTDVVALSPIAYALDNVRILPEDLPIAAGDATKNNAVITTGAISGAGIDVTNTIRDQSQSLKDSKGDAVNVEKKEDIKVTVSVNSAKLVTVSNGVIKTKAGYEDATTDTVDEIRVTIELYGQKCIRTIKVRKA